MSRSPVQATRKTLVEHAAERLRDDIFSGALPPGERVGLEALAGDLGMSQIPLREALRALVGEGLIVPLPHRGYVVASADLDDLEETYRLRLVLEPLAVELAVPQLVESDFDELERELDLIATTFRVGDWVAHRDHHHAFHFGIYRKCGSVWLVRFSDMLWSNAQRYQQLSRQIPGQYKRRLEEHGQILAACRAGDAKLAATEMREHVNRALEAVRPVVSSSATG